MTPVHRAPMRSRSDAVDHGAAVEWALGRGVVGVGRQGAPHEQDRVARRLDRFAEVPGGSYVWTLDADGQAYVGRIVGALRHEPAGAAFDLVDVRDCEWRVAPRIPPGVEATFGRGGRNFQRVHAAGVEQQTDDLWRSVVG